MKMIPTQLNLNFNLKSENLAQLQIVFDIFIGIYLVALQSADCV